MGYCREAICHTCKTEFYLGYGGSKTSAALENKFREEHPSDHDYFFYCSEYCFEKDGHLWVDGVGWVDDVVLVYNFSEYERVKLNE